jgi:septal ring factor EnvC (AmiA/AmiB activator)
MISMKKIIYIFSLLLVLSPTGFCYEKSDLKKVEKQISQHRQISKKLVKEVKNTEKQLKDIRSKSIKVAKSIQANESSISSIKEDMNDLTASIKIKEMQLEKNKQNSIAILSSIRRISSMPTDGFILASKNPQDLINTRVLINSVLPNLINQAKKLNKDIKEIEESKQSVLDKKDKLLSLNKSKEKEMKEIKKLLKEKMAIKSKLTSKQRKEKAELNKLAKKASSIKDFVKKLQSRKVKSKPGLKPSKKITSPKPKSDVKFSGRKGNMPIAGKIVLGYGKKNAQNVTNYGWEVKGNSKGLVTCPIGGEVLYSGEFGSYDNIVVFDNGAGYNLLLAGMGKVGINVGDKVQAGEPIGFLKSTRLYVELRKDGKLINPKRVIK